MAKINENPIIFALSNPTNKAECTAEDAYRCTSGKVLFASGSPFSNVNYNGKIFKPGQGNNAYIFPGVALGAILFNIRHIDDETFLIAAHEVANCVTEKDFKVGRLYPRLNRIREVSVKIAVAIGEYAYEIGMAGLYPKPENMKQFVLSQIYQTTYDELIDVTYDWPAHDMKHGFPVPVSRRESVDDPASIRNIAKSAVLKQKHPNSADDETIPEWCHSKNDIKLYMLYRHERETPKKHGFEILKDSRFCKGMAFSLYERQHLGIHGLLPPAIMTEDQQAYRAILNLRKQPNDLARYVQLDSLQERDEKLYYRVICNHVKELLPIVYTPTVGLACQKYGFIYRRPKGLYITIHDNSISKIYHILSNWPEADVRVMVVTDGERILGLGDLGCYGMGIPVGKLALYVALAGVLPKWCLPVVLDVGTDNETLLKDPLYIGLRRKRVRGEDYDEFIDNFMKACTKKFGQKLLIHFEDFARQNAYRLLDRYREKYCVFNDDIQGTAAAVLAGLLACRQHTGRPLSAEKFIFLGAGAAAMGITELCISHMETEGVKRKKARSHIYLVDINGLITKNRLHMEKQHVPYAKDMPEITNLLELIKLIKPTALIGTSTTGGAFNEEIVRTMAEFNQKPIIFALSNPTKKAECTAEQAIKWTDGRVLFASGSPFENVKYNGKLFKPGQGNNSYIYPAVGMAAILFQIRHIDDNMFLIAAQEVAKSVSSDDYQCRRLYPSFSRIREVSLKIIIALGKYSYEKNMASLYPKPENVENFVRSQMYNTNYDKIVDYRYDWPEQDMVQGYPVPND
ncbi:unnamed protein product [Thelazia callipaeda]|uniref:Malic enzyme n=1 Tax=Thelazia callipaeda TaxID=103827 RepID=A0A0N5D5U5_THECL|nr:unnamed protein product [Thelazia callipaeda]